MAKSGKAVTIKINQQQAKVLERLRQEGTFGDSIGEIVLNVFRAYAGETRETEEG